MQNSQKLWIRKLEPYSYNICTFWCQYPGVCHCLKRDEELTLVSITECQKVKFKVVAERCKYIKKAAKPLKSFQFKTKNCINSPIFCVLLWKDDLCWLTGGHPPRTIFFSLFTPNLSKVVNQDHLSSSQSSLETTTKSGIFIQNLISSGSIALFILWLLISIDMHVTIFEYSFWCEPHWGVRAAF